jgi:hypothetical protein
MQFQKKYPNNKPAATFPIIQKASNRMLTTKAPKPTPSTMPFKAQQNHDSS